MNKSFYVTTPIFYPTGEPHIGTSYTMYIADTLARYYRKQGADTFFLAGTDEHGANIAKIAAEKSLEPKAYVDEQSNKFKTLWSQLGISLDHFIRTTDKPHEEFAAELLQKSYENGDIYEGSYSGWYCSSCEAYYTEKDLIDGKCPNHPTKTPIWTEEKNWYFKWSKYQGQLLQFYEEHPDFVVPEKWYNYVKEFVKAGLTDIPVTRANVKWGIKVPFDPEQTIYVWYDALPNYLSIFTYPEYKDKNLEAKFWPEATHVIGKDIIKFHAILWPAMLFSAGLQPPKQIIVHGFFTINGQKIGKSNGNAVSPLEFTKIYGNDAVKYSIISEFQIGEDGDFNYDRLKVKYDELANNWGNLLNRVIHLANTKNIKYNEKIVDPEVSKKLEEFQNSYHKYFADRKLFDAVSLVNELSTFGNKYIDTNKPWEKDKTEDQINITISSLFRLLEVVNDLYEPFLPESSVKAKEALSKKEKIILFPKIEDSRPEDPKPENPKKSYTKSEVLDLLKPIKIAKVLSFEKHPNADRLQLVNIDLGDLKKQIITGANNFKVGELVPYLGEGNIIPGYLLQKGEKIILQKKDLRGLPSDSMILAEDEIGLSTDHLGIYIIEGEDSLIGKSIIEYLKGADIAKIMSNL